MHEHTHTHTHTHALMLITCIYTSRVIFNQFCQPGADSSKANRTGIQLLGVVVANGMVPYDPDTAGRDLNEKK